jgi:hypothetical protein
MRSKDACVSNTGHSSIRPMSLFSRLCIAGKLVFVLKVSKIQQIILPSHLYNITI